MSKHRDPLHRRCASLGPSLSSRGRRCADLTGNYTVFVGAATSIHAAKLHRGHEAIGHLFRRSPKRPAMAPLSPLNLPSRAPSRPRRGMQLPVLGSCNFARIPRISVQSRRQEDARLSMTEQTRSAQNLTKKPRERATFQVCSAVSGIAGRIERERFHALRHPASSASSGIALAGSGSGYVGVSPSERAVLFDNRRGACRTRGASRVWTLRNPLNF